MKIRISRKPNPKLKEFNKKEWSIANKAHYGQALDWSTNNFILTGYNDNNNIVGTLGFKVEAGVAYIGTILVAKDQRSKGIGAKLVQKAEKIASNDKAHKIYLQTGKNWESVKFYEKLGYRITGQLPNHYFHEDFVELTKFL